MIDVLSSLIKVKMSIGWHRCLDGHGLVHVKLLQHVIGVLGLTYECAIPELLDLKSKKELCGGINPHTLTAKLGPAWIDGTGPPERRRAA